MLFGDQAIGFDKVPVGEGSGGQTSSGGKNWGKGFQGLLLYQEGVGAGPDAADSGDFCEAWSQGQRGAHDSWAIVLILESEKVSKFVEDCVAYIFSGNWG